MSETAHAARAAQGEHGAARFWVDEFGCPRLAYDGWDLTLTRGEHDDVPVLFVDTSSDDGSPTADNRRGPRCRIILNDEPLWANPPYAPPAEEEPLS